MERRSCFLNNLFAHFRPATIALLSYHSVLAGRREMAALTDAPCPCQRLNPRKYNQHVEVLQVLQRTKRKPRRCSTPCTATRRETRMSRRAALIQRPVHSAAASQAQPRYVPARLNRSARQQAHIQAAMTHAGPVEVFREIATPADLIVYSGCSIAPPINCRACAVCRTPNGAFWI
jgi:hypothetical protein